MTSGTAIGFTSVPAIIDTDNGTGDAFGRLRTSGLTTLFDSTQQYDTSPLLWDTKIVGTGSVTHLPNESATMLEVGTASGDKVCVQTKEYIRYQPGKSQLIFNTGVLGTPKENCTKYIGYGDDENGVFFGQDGDGTFVLLRSKKSGTVSDSRKVYQEDWNMDRLNGLDASGVIADWTGSEIFIIDIEWLGVGRVRCGLDIAGVVVYVHEFLNDNEGANAGAYMTTANLPVRYEIVNTGTTASATQLEKICSMVGSEGGIQETAAYPFVSTVRSAVSAPTTTPVPLVAIRPALTFNGIPNRSRLLVDQVKAFCTSGSAVIEVYYNPTITGGSWSAVNASSAVEENLSMTGFSGGLVVSRFIVSGGNSSSISPVAEEIFDRLPFGIGIDADTPITLLVAAYEDSSNPVCSALVSWREVR